MLLHKEIEVFLPLQNVFPGTKIKKTHIIVISIHSSLSTEFKTYETKVTVTKECNYFILDSGVF